MIGYDDLYSIQILPNGSRQVSEEGMIVGTALPGESIVSLGDRIFSIEADSAKTGEVRLAEQPRARRRQHRIAPGPVEKRDAEIDLKVRDLRAYRRLRLCERPAGGGSRSTESE